MASKKAKVKNSANIKPRNKQEIKFKLYPEPEAFPDKFTQGACQQWEEFNMDGQLSWSSLVEIIYETGWKELQNIYAGIFTGWTDICSSKPDSIRTSHVVAKSANDLLKLITDAVRNRKLKVSSDKDGLFVFNASEITQWLINQDILLWLLKTDDIQVSTNFCELIQKSVYGEILPSLQVNKLGNVNWEFYASLPLWPTGLVIQIFREADPWDWNKIQKASRFDLAQCDHILVNAIAGSKIGEPVKNFHPAAICLWAKTWEIPIPAELDNIFNKTKGIENELVRVDHESALLEENLRTQKANDVEGFKANRARLMSQAREKRIKQLESDNEILKEECLEMYDLHYAGREGLPNETIHGQEQVPAPKSEQLTTPEVLQGKENLPPALDTLKAKNQYLNIQMIKEFEKLLKKEKTLTGKQLLEKPTIKDIITFSGLTSKQRAKDTHIIKKWVAVARKEAKVPSKYGIRPKQ